MPRKRSNPKPDPKPEVVMDGQKHTHEEKYAYDFKEWPEFYDLWVEAFITNWPAEDVGVFREVLEERLQQIKKYKFSGPVNVIDVGTGTGRIVLDLWRQEIQGAERITYWGIDNSQAMLNRAKSSFNAWKGAIKNQDALEKAPERPCLTVVPNWVCASAAGFLSTMPSVKGCTDLIVFAAGGLSHITTDAEMELFLKDVALALRPSPKGSEAMAVISVLHEMDPHKNFKLKQIVDNADLAGTKVKKPYPVRKPYYGTDQTLEIPSRELPGTFYHRSPVLSRWTSDDVRTDSFTFKVFTEKAGADGSKVQETVSKGTLEWSLRVFDRTAWEAIVERCGLAIYGVRDGKHQDYFLLGLNP